MIEQIINEWLSDFKNQSSTKENSYSTSPARDNDIVTALYSYLDDINKYNGVSCVIVLSQKINISTNCPVYFQIICIVDVCDVLFKYYRSSEAELRRFTLQYLPQILYLYLNAVANSDKKVIIACLFLVSRLSLMANY